MLLLQPEVILKKLEHLPESRKREVLDFIEFLILKTTKSKKKDVDFSEYLGIYSGKDVDLEQEIQDMRLEWERNI